MTSANPKRGIGTRPLTQAVVAASLAPSIFNTQPWRWRVEDGVAELRADRSRQLHVADPEGRLMILSCGGALHHALVALAAEGYITETDHFPTAADPDLLARIRVIERQPASAETMRQYQSLLNRHTDRRPFADKHVPEAALVELQKAAAAWGAHVQVLRREQVVTLITAASRAESVQMADPAYRAELARWINRAADAEDGVPISTAVGPIPRRVPVREFTFDAHDIRPDAAPGDMYARYAVLSTNGDTPADWLTAGKALSAVLIAAVGAGLAISPMSDVTEVLASRQQLRGLLGGVGYPQIALRIGISAHAEPAPAAGRRDPKTLIDYGEEEN